ncbi:WecB/TagA/CpsF family glycosyltransferase [Leptolyngbya sp. FACHB-17]|uniref:WecB/TagA/CpsF family glycosyltransferase n=1 Tax=unclassified Leptolyngbya TaxID=2650499 RepID=UPI0016804A42|nr:WecB/TagA/CpsF family glycosyltransferase [Leptolyngbya sp. FACHB-17]MBD2080059.1 WecB/TagA/CpsF family glycosyltransferase [Leptolyngbya sp. FACHB-17]
MIGQTKLHQLKDSPSLSVYLLGRRITCMTVAAIVDAIHTACTEGTKLTVAHYNVHGFNLSMQLPWFHNFLQSAEIAHCDSVGILKAIGFMGLKLPLQYRASYSLLMPKLLSHCNQQNFSIFLLGAKPECVDAAIAQVRQQYPNVQVSGHHGYFDIHNPDANGQVVQQINQVKPQILVVGMGMPIQEDWIRLNRDQLDVNVIMMGGAVIDRLAGIVPDCPPLLSDLGLEWVYRLFREPKRLATRYLLGNPAFLLHIALAKAYSFSLRVQLMEPLSRSKKLSNTGVESIRAELKSAENRLVDADPISG